ncbi:hypothetical protein ACFT0G_06090 [Streptomyces sp. NPDC057020]|uniref:hypothetical protein n=1 Tax=unclassified Streptomyces TaxID=2593676 RepID=UPI003634C95A
MQTERTPNPMALTDADRAHPAVIDYLAAQERVQDLRRQLREAEGARDDAAADLPAEGDHRGAVIRIAEHLGEKTSQIEGQKKRGRRARREAMEGEAQATA